MTLKVGWSQALAWRMKRHELDPIGGLRVDGVVRRLCGVQAQVASSAELAIRARRVSSKPGEVARALSSGSLIKTWAMRGTLHLLTPQEGGAFLSLLAAGRSWELPSWEKYFGMSPKLWDRMRPVVREALDGTPLTREELIAEIVKDRGLRHLGEPMRSGWGTLFKPLAWQGDLCYGPSQGPRVTFTRPDHASSRWRGVPDPDEAAPTVITSYLGAYGPASVEALSAFLSRGRISKRQLKAWFEGVGDRLEQIEVDGESAWIRREDAEELASTKATKAARLLPGFDQYVLGPGTDDGRVVSATRRGAVSKQSGWIAPVVVAGGIVRGTWELDADHANVAWFAEAGRPPRKALDAEVERWSAILDRPLRLTVASA